MNENVGVALLVESNLSVVIITKNEAETIEKCLSSVFGQSVKPLEAIIVDGRSTDNTLEIARRFPVKIVVESGHASPSNARNVGVENAKGDIVLVMGADTELDKDCVKNALIHFENPDVLVVIPTLGIQIHSRLEKIQRNWFWGTRSRLRTPYGTGSSIQFIRREAYLKVKFDTNFGFGDDSDFRRRLVKLYAGSERIVTSPDSKILVDLPHSLSEMKSQYLWYGRTSRKYYGRYHSFGSMLRLGSLLMPFAVLVSAIVAVFVPYVIYLLLFLIGLLIARNVIVCFRSKSLYFFEFVFFEFARSILFLAGMVQGLVAKKTGR